jgi:hypothetical protein
VSNRPPIQLGLLPGFDAPALSLSAAVAEPIAEAPRRRAVSAERAMLAAQTSLLRPDRPDAPSLAVDPPELHGWREELGRARPRMVAGVCSAVAADRRRPDGSLAPCPWATCPRHLLLDVGQVVEIRGRRHADLLINRAGEPATMGRRPALAAVPTDGEVDEFDAAALDRLEELPDTCELDVIARHGEAVPVEAIAAALGVSEEQVRLDTLNAARALGLVMDNGEPGPGEFGVADAILERLRVRPRRIRRTWRGTVADVLPAPALIVRIEREAPPVREPSAGEIFTF